MASWRQTNAGGVNGVTVAGGSGGSADGSTPYDTVTIGSGATAVYDNTHTLFGAGGMAIQFATGATSAVSTASLTTSVTWATPVYVSACYYFPTVPTAQVRVLSIQAVSTVIAAINITSTGKIQASAPVSSTVSTGTVTIPGATFIRIELALLALSATVGQVEGRWFSDPFSTTLAEPARTTAASANTGTTTADRAALGIGVGMANAPAYWATYLQVSNTGYPTPPLWALSPIARPALQRAAIIRAGSY